MCVCVLGYTPHTLDLPFYFVCVEEANKGMRPQASPLSCMAFVVDGVWCGFCRTSCCFLPKYKTPLKKTNQDLTEARPWGASEGTSEKQREWPPSHSEESKATALCVCENMVVDLCQQVRQHIANEDTAKAQHCCDGT